MRKHILDEETKQKSFVDSQSEKLNVCSQWYDQDEAGALPDDGDLSLRKKTGGDNETFFSFIRKAHLHEAQEFRRKGYNSQVPEVDPMLMTQLQKAVAAVKPRICLFSYREGPFDQLWLLEKISQIERFIDRLSVDILQEWVKKELASKRIAQSLVRRLESTLQTLTRVVYILDSINDNTPEHQQDAVRKMLISEFTDTFASVDERAVMQALKRMSVNAADNVAWSSLMQITATAWEADKLENFRAVIEATRRDAGKANRKARELSGRAQIFFGDIAAFLQKLSGEWEKELIYSNRDTSPRIIHKAKNNDEAAAGYSQTSETFGQNFKARLHNGKLQCDIGKAIFIKYWERGARIIQSEDTTEIPSKKQEKVIADSIIRGILWQWQQSAIKILYPSAALLSKVKALKKIRGMFLSDIAVGDNRNEQEGSDISVSEPGEEDVYTQLRQWVHDKHVRETPESRMTAKLAVLKQLLDSDIANAHSVLARMGKTKESIQAGLERQLLSVKKMVGERLPTDVTDPLWRAVNEFMFDIVRDLTDAAKALDEALRAVEHPTCELSQAKKQAGKAQLLSIKVKENISAKSAQLTGRPLEEYSRGSRLARHWAALAKERERSDWHTPDAEEVFASLNKHALLDGTLSTGDPKGYLFAIRLAGEFENASNDELRLPINPDQYTELEKNLTDFIVSWGQKRASRGAARIIIELFFEQALDTVAWSFTNIIRTPYKIFKASIKIPYKVNKMNNYIMPGDDKSYKAIYGFLGKKLKQFGFNLITTPVPGVIKFAIGSGVTAGSTLYNSYVENKEKTFSAVYDTVVKNGKSKKIKMDSKKEMIFDLTLDSAFIASAKGVNRAWKSKGGECNDSIDLQFSGNKNYCDESVFNEQPASKRGKRSIVNSAIPQNSLDKRMPYHELSDDMKKTVYFNGIKYVLQQIENDESLPQEARNNAYLARMGAPVVVPVDIYGYQLNNTFLIPGSPGYKSGILVRLDSENFYYPVGEGKDLLENIKWAMPYNANKSGHYTPPGSLGLNSNRTPSGIDYLEKIRSGEYSYDKYFNYKNPEPMDILSLSLQLENNMRKDYEIKKNKIENNMLIPRAIAGSQIPDPEVSTSQLPYQLNITWEKPTNAEFLRGFSRPFATLSGQVQKIISHATGDSIQDTEIHVEKADYIGTWVDITVGAVTAFTPQGAVLSVAQSAAEISADISNDKTPEPLAVAGLVFSCIPAGKISTRLGRFSKTRENIFEYTLKIGGKTIDLASLGVIIKAAVDTEDPLAIYQALMASGMNAKDSYDMMKGMSEKANIKQAENSKRIFCVEKQKRVNENIGTTGAGVNELPKGRKFKIGNIEMLGRKVKGSSIEISLDGGVSWQSGNKLHLVAFTLQNAGGKSVLPRAGSPEPDTTKSGDSTDSKRGNEQEFLKHMENGHDPDHYLKDVKTDTPNENVRPFHAFGKNLLGRVHDGQFEKSKDGGITWSKGKLPLEILWRWRSQNDTDIQNANHSGREKSSLSSDSNSGPSLIKREPVLQEFIFKEFSPDEAKLLEDTELTLKSSMGSDYNRYIFAPKENCAHAARSVVNVLKSDGYTNVRIVEMGIWPNGGEATVPTNHYIVMAEKGGEEIVVDLTAGQFEQYGFTGDVITTKNNWISRWQQELKSKPRTLVKLAPLVGGTDTSTFSAFSPYNDARQTVPDGSLIQSPAWYQNIN